ncbi:MAG: hypothetical protein WC680_11195 [Sulfuricurvum sp.]|jgi:hypothetical protein
MKQGDIKDFIKFVLENEADFIEVKKIRFDTLFGDEKAMIVSLVRDRNIGVKKLFDGFVVKNLLRKDQFKSFSRWIKSEVAKSSDRSTDVKIEDEIKHTKHIDSNLLAIDEVKTGNIEQLLHDSRNLFHGFDMNEQPDEKTNPIPVRPEIDHLYLCEIFAKNHELNNDRIVNILLCAIKLEKKNIFTKTWSELLLKNGETKEEYYARLQGISDSDVDKSYEILDATTCMQGYALAAKYDGLKLVRRNNG